MGWWANWRLKRRLTLERRPPRELYEREWKLPEPRREVLLGRSYRKALRQALAHVRHYVTGEGLRCTYCGARMPDPRRREEVIIRIGYVTVYRDPPVEGRDLRIVVDRGWAADVEHLPAAARCRKCGQEVRLGGERWGVGHPSYGFERLSHWIK